MPIGTVPDAPPQGPVVQGFAGNGFKVDGQIYGGGLWLTPAWARGWDAPVLEALDEMGLAELLDAEPAPEFLLLGTGATTRRPSAEFTRALQARRIGIEPMDSRAAARTWGMLRGEGRRIVAALLPLT